MNIEVSKWRIVDSGIVSPEFSAAADEAILNARARGIAPETLHFYVRECPTVSLGCNQSVKESVNLDIAQEKGVRIIRRFSGGSAIYTDQGQLIFALILDRSLVPSDVMRSYEKICRAIILGLSFIGISAEYKPVNDILVNGYKISGSAQLRREDVVLHHGTLMIDTDLELLTRVLLPQKKENGSQSHGPMTNLQRLSGFSLSTKDVRRAIIDGVGETFDANLYPGELDNFEREEIDRLIREKYGKREWNWKL